MKTILTYQKYNESVDESNWKKGVDNTKLFVYYTNKWDIGSDKMYIQGCRTCNEPTPLINTFKERQLLGNVYQSLCNCSVCNNPILYDEHNLDELDFFLKNKEDIIAEDKKNRKKGLNIIITTRELGSSIIPTEIVDVEPFSLYHIHLKSYVVEKLYVYVKQSNTNDLSDNPYNNAYQNVSGEKWKVVIDLNKKDVYSPYPWYHHEDKLPSPVKDIFNKYIKEYCL
jgi:hypothetical protein